MMVDDIEVEIVCPLYESYNIVDRFLSGIRSQKKINIKKINFVITDCGDQIEDKLNAPDISWKKINKSEFNHAKTREEALFNVESNIAVMCTDDIVLKDEYAVYKLIKPIIEKKCVYAFGRQICTNNTIEKYTRKLNYPSYDYVVEKKDIEKMQIKAFFCSDSFAAYDVGKFKEINGYDGVLLPTNEDMYYAKKILYLGYKMMYVSNACVEHSHDFTLKEVYRRYFLVGRFFKENPDFKNYKSMDSGFRLAYNIFFEIIKRFDVKNLFIFLPNMIARYLGKRKGEK